MAQAATEDLDLLALTGDIIHFPSPASVDYILAQMDALGVPAIYTSGNHDVHYTDEPVNAEVRLTRLAALQPLHDGDPDCAARDSLANARKTRWAFLRGKLTQKHSRVKLRVRPSSG